MVLAMYRVHSSVYAGTDERRIVVQKHTSSIIINESRCFVIVELYLEVEDESTGRWTGESKSPS